MLTIECLFFELSEFFILNITKIEWVAEILYFILYEKLFVNEGVVMQTHNQF